jgi:hypothetical protein
LWRKKVSEELGDTLKFSYKVHKNDTEVLLAVCDASLLNKNLEGDGFSFFVSKDFYHEGTCDENHIKRLIRDATIINAIGEDVISLMIKEKVIEGEKIIKIDGVPHAQVISI